MVNVPPPILPLLCSTPPPIDFGDDDEDIDLPPVDGVAEEFGDFLEGDNKSDEPLPSPRPSSVTDLPTMSIYDDLIPSNETYTNHSATPSPVGVGALNTDTTKEERQDTPVEAFNYNVAHQAKEATTETITTDDQETVDKITTPTTIEEITICSDDRNELNDITAENANRSAQEKKVEQLATSSQDTATTVKKSITPLTSMVSIEDLEDDLSEDELYSPKTPKNINETDVLTNDYFKIHYIQQDKNIVKDSTSKEMSGSVFTAGRENDFTSITSQSLDLPPPLEDPDGDDNDDFGDFADFQDFNTTTMSPTTINQTSVDKSVPANEIKTNQLCSDEDEFDDFVQHTHPDKSSEHINGVNLDQPPLDQDSHTASEKSHEDKNTPEDDFEDFTSHISSVSKLNEIHSNEMIPKGELPEKSQANESKVTHSEDGQIEENINESFVGFNEDTLQVEKDLTNLQDEIKTPDENFEKDNSESSILTHSNDSKENTNNSIKDDDDDFNDFADFDQVMPPPKQDQIEVSEHNIKISQSQIKIPDDDFDDDDDFGDFNAAEPIMSGHSIQTTSQHLNTATAAPVTLQTPKNLNERISKILQLMFSSSNSSNNLSSRTDTELKKQKIQDIPFTSIDAAKALEYQWLNSETRHSFIKSLGIDSRNILYGENWNPSLPRFAANLSFNPLKPLKPVTSSSGTESACPIDPAPVNTSDFNKTILNPLASIKKDSNEIDWKTSSEQTTKAFNENRSAPEDVSNMAVAPSASVPYVVTEPPESLTIFENPLDIEENKFSKTQTPPISEMESVNTFSNLPTTASLEIDLPPAATQILNELNIELNESEVSKEALEVVVASTTFSGSFKETHIYTPPKTTEHSSSSSSTSTTSPSKMTNIDFDYEKAAMGVIINETVVKKEYRDIEYNSPFSMDAAMKTISVKSEVLESSNSFGNLQSNNIKNAFSNDPDDEFNDEFSDFQSVPSDPITATTPVAPTPIYAPSNLKPIIPASNASPIAPEISKASNVSACGMILSPAILIPQAISMESNKPKIEWGDSTASINPEELARIEELFPEPKLGKPNTSSSSQKSTPTHQAATPSISAAVANKESAGNNDDDDWSDFVSVPIVNNNKIITNNNIAAKSQSNSPFKQRSPVNTYKTQNYNNSNSNNDDEWSDFVSGAPPQVACNPVQAPVHRVPQFNSGAWQNANFYNNPLSLYHKGPLNMHSANQHQQSPKNFQNNNNNYNQYNQFQTTAPAGQHASQHQHQQQIHIMQNFSTAPVPTPERLAASAKNNQFQVGSAKVAPSIALIPDLGFVAPAIPTHTSFINSLPKPSINSKK